MFDVKQFDIQKFDSILSRGLSNGLGERGNQVCIEAAICETLGLPHGDDPQCVADSVRIFKITLNDSCWPSPEARAKGLRDLGIAQLGSKGVVSDQEFTARLSKKMIQIFIPKLFREVFPANDTCLAAAQQCEIEGTVTAAYSARSAARSAYSAYSATYSATYSVRSAAYSAYSAARSADSAARSADSAARSAVRSAADSARSAVRSADSADSAARSAADSARSAVRSADSADSAARSAAYSARSAAYSAADSADSAVRSAADSADTYLILAARLALEVLHELKSPGVDLL